MRNTKALHYRGFEITLRAVSDGDGYAAGYVVERPNNPVEPFSTLLASGYPSLEAALSEADSRARMFVDRLLDQPDSRNESA